ncbi:MAG TPA: 2,3-bisphosphoglycerate-independent phosphoglycerate mutase [Symbiobacteriaceae bacterium]|nr:2,3-bisphosphoglycerate-independent phosphoglycerate mutase [Symbiobacteriaceae bacterium]
MASFRRPVALIILDGWGLNPDSRANAVVQAKHPNYDAYMAKYPHTQLTAHGEAVGQIPGQMGDSNVGHLNLGAGRIVYQTLPRIYRAIADGSYAKLPAFQKAFERAKSGRGGTSEDIAGLAPQEVPPRKGVLHLCGLVSDGGVHSHVEHLLALLDVCKAEGVQTVYIHAFTDGRDVPPKSAGPFIQQVEAKIQAIGLGKIATLSGRYYAMDRDKRWERTGKAFQALVTGEGEKADSAAAAIEAAYGRGETDEFILPTVIDSAGTIKAEDGVIFFNFRPDRARQIVRALHESAFDGFARPDGFQPVAITTMTEYDAKFVGIQVAFEPKYVDMPLGKVIADAGLRQLRVAETEKYPHVTYFFNGMEEEPYPGEERVMIPSPKVATYDLQPEMSAYEIAETAADWITNDKLDFMVLNFANPDMVGHTGILEAGIKAVEAVDECLGKVISALLAKGGAALVLADHGNCDQMVDYETGAPHTNHTLNPVPCILIDDSRLNVKLAEGGVLGNAAPTLLDVIGLAKPSQMDQDSLIIKA